MFVLSKINEILSWEKATERERDSKFVELVAICARFGQDNTGTGSLEPRFLSRCRVIEFSYGMAGEIAAYLDRVWHAEGGNGNAPDLARLAKESRNNVRDASMKLEVELMAL